MLSIRLPAEIEERLNAVVWGRGCSRASFVRKVIVERCSVVEDLQIAEQRLKDHQAGRSRTCMLEEAAQRSALAN